MFAMCGGYSAVPTQSRDISGFHSTDAEGSRWRCSDAVSLGWGVFEISQESVAFRFKGLLDC